MKEFPPFRFDTVNQCLWRRRTKGADERILLTPKAFAVLRHLVEHAGHLVAHDELLDAVWPNTHIQPQAIKKLVLDLRSSLGDRAKKPLFIETLHRRGYRFIAAVSEGTAVLPAVPAQPARGKLVGRERELSELGDCLGKALRGERQIVFITGEPGIGKTALAEAFQRQAVVEAPGLRIARGQCVEGYGGKEAYYPMLEALGQLCRGAGGDSVVQILAAQAPTWLVQFPALVKREQREMLQREILGSTRERMLREIGDALEAITSASPMLLVFEDLQLVDDSTLDLISALARRQAPAKLMLIATKRPVDMVIPEHPLKALKQDLLLHRLCAEIALAPLSKSSLTQLLSRELRQQALPDELGAFVHQRSEGNPLFAIAILEHLIAQQFLVRQAAGGAAEWRLRTTLLESDAGLPGDLAQMVELEIERLSPREQSALEAGSLMKVAFPAWAVAAALDEDAVEAEDLCDGLARRLHFVERAGQDELPGGVCSAFYVFAHGLYREVLYRRQSAARRARSHTRIAQRLGQLFKGREPDVAREMAMHFEAAGSWQLAAAALRSAALHAERRQAHAEAAELLERALRIAHSFGGSERTPEAAR